MTEGSLADDRLVLTPPSIAPEPHPRDWDPPSPRSWNFRYDRPPMRHLARRFFQSLSRRPPSKTSRAWADAMMNQGERELFHAMQTFDQRHAIGVAKLAYELTGDRLCARAALLHDVGKIDCRLGPVGRSVATLFGRYLPTTKDIWAREWLAHVRTTPHGRLRPRSLKQRFASYWVHPWVGRQMLEAAGADEFVSAWAEHHHHPFIVEDLMVSWREACVLWGADGD